MFVALPFIIHQNAHPRTRLTPTHTPHTHTQTKQNTHTYTHTLPLFGSTKEVDRMQWNFEELQRTLDTVRSLRTSHASTNTSAANNSSSSNHNRNTSRLSASAVHHTTPSRRVHASRGGTGSEMPLPRSPALSPSPPPSSPQRHARPVPDTLPPTTLAAFATSTPMASPHRQPL